MALLSTSRLLRPRLVYLALPALCWACESGQRSDNSVKRGETGTALLDEPSPNASILPEPLGDKPRFPENGSLSAGALSSTATPIVPRPEPIPMPSREPLSEDTLLRGAHGAGYRAHGRFVWSLSQPHLVVDGAKVQAWPQLTFELLRETPEQAARLRIVLSSGVFSLPEGTELRLRADRIGAVIVWPDGRSYRPLLPGTLPTLLSERRVDRLPFLPVTARELEPIVKAGRSVARREIETVLGTAEMETTALGDLAYAAPLLCEVLLGMVRVSGTEELCPEGQLPLRLAVRWRDGGGFLFELLGYVQEPRLELDQQRIPPWLPIYKPGELPPRDSHLLPTQAWVEALGLKAPGDPQLPRPTLQAPAAAPLKPGQPPQELLAPDEVLLRNSTDQPLIVMLNRYPFSWLDPGEQRSVRVQGTAIGYSARDFWGHFQLDQGTLAGSGSLTFAQPEQAAEF